MSLRSAREPQNSSNSANLSTSGRLIRALTELWEDHSQGEISVRMISARAQTSVSAIDYHFGNLEQLFVAAQKVAIDRARTWMDAVAADMSSLGGAGLPSSSVASLVAAIIDDWTERQRPLALAWREAHAVACTRPNYADPHRQWTGLWSAFWSDVCAKLGLADHTASITLFFDGEATQHLIRWRRSLDRALLDETTLAMFGLLMESGPPSSRIRRAYQTLAEEEYGLAAAGQREDVAIQDEAAALLADEGIASLTFRAVAKRAGVTLGAVSYCFGTKSNMLRMAMQRLYETSAGHTPREIELQAPTPLHMLDAIVEGVSGGQQPILRAFDEITLNLYRSEGHGALCGVIRGFRDPIGEAVLRRLFDRSGGMPPSLVAAMSSIVRGYGHHSLVMPADEGRDLGYKALGPFHRQ